MATTKSLFFTYFYVNTSQKFILQTGGNPDNNHQKLLLIAKLSIIVMIYYNNNNNTGYLLHAISPKSKEHIACYKHITNYRYIVAKYCYETLLQLQNIDKTLQKHTLIQQYS